ncbi:DNA adenine methylase [Breoghania sp. L-A4]|uniref:DNA adenine methylase n=1 Tax=Breoghania sp. L-A4 TaxID=2304600 RepID=UPI000E3598B3|nr:DNA adenine methylase [Breoghania sp. L-A4]AXS39289.1 DNA adenine methylase [Breoghania sp. L-A4]
MSILTEMRDVNPVPPAAGYIGGKSKLAVRLIDLISTVPHELYAEPFVGMGGVFLRRPSAPKAEVINDLSGDVSTFFRILQRHYVAFVEMLRFQLTTRREFERLTNIDPSTLTDLERAARFLYLQRTAYAGKVSGRTFGTRAGAPALFDITRIVPLLESIHERLAGVVIEALPFDRFIKTYDRPHTLFFIDPPYFGCETDYGAGMFTRDDFARLAAQLAEIKGHFILTINDCPEIREIFAAFELTAVDVSYSIQREAPKEFGELIITGPRALPRLLI